jgi:undecaprenyl-diphosphatase
VRTTGDTHDFQVVNDFARHTGWLHGPAAAYANYGVVLFAGLLLAGWWLARRDRNVTTMARALLAPAGVLVAVAVTQPIVHAVNEPRPYTELPQTLVLVHRSLDASFPSDHATMAGAATTGMLLVSRRLGWVAAAAAVLMAFTRVYVGAHYPVDGLAGLAVGAVVSVAVALAATPVVARVLASALSTPLRPLLTDEPPTSSIAQDA